MPNDKSVLDLTAVPCPMNLVRIKVALHQKAPHSIKVLLAADSQAAKHTASTLGAQGYNVVQTSTESGDVLLEIEGGDVSKL